MIKTNGVNQMKKCIYFLLTVITITICSCKKDDSVNNPTQAGITGTWAWSSSLGGMTGNDNPTPEKTGRKRSMIFLENKQFFLVENGDTIQKTDYFLSNEASILFHKNYDFVTVNYKFRISNPDSVITLPMRYIINSMSDTLSLTEDVFDGYSHWYLRKN
jgi:hypothetical protein